MLGPKTLQSGDRNYINERGMHASASAPIQLLTHKCCLTSSCVRKCMFALGHWGLKVAKIQNGEYKMLNFRERKKLQISC